MNANRRIILQLLAMGRVTAAEAERLLAACDDGLTVLGAVVACGAVLAGLVPSHAADLASKLMHLARAFAPGSFSVLHRLLSLLTHLPGGML